MKTIFILLVAIVPCFAQQQPPPDPMFLQRAATALQQQRNECLDQQANIRIALIAAQEEVDKLKKELAEVKAKELAK